MKKNRNFIIGIRIVMAVLAFIAFMEGIYILNNTNDSMITAIEQDNDQHLYELAESIDINLRNTLNHISLDFNYVLKRYLVKEATKKLVETGYSSELEQKLLDSVVNDYENVRIFLCYDGDELLMASSSENIEIGSNYTFLNNSDLTKEDDSPYTMIYHAPISICYDEHGGYFIAIESKMEDPELTFYALLDFDSLYDNILMKEDIPNRWIVFYNEESNLWVQNHRNQPAFKIMSQDEVEKRQDGYTYILAQDRTKERGRGVTYEYANEARQETLYRLVALPRVESENGLFALGVAADFVEDVEIMDFFSRRMVYLVLLFTICMLLLIVLILNLRIEHKELRRDMEEMDRNQRLRNALVQSELKNAMNQIHPHFLYNALSAIRELIYEKPEDAADMLYDFTHHLRASIRSVSQNELIEFYEEIENIKAYANIEKMRFGDRFQIIYKFEFVDFQIAPLSIQPLVENAIRHGIFERGKNGGTIVITSDLVEEDAVIHVIDDGVGFDYEEIMRQVEQGERDSTGLSNAILRLKNYHNAKVQVSSTPGEGTDIEIILPKILDQ